LSALFIERCYTLSLNLDKQQPSRPLISIIRAVFPPLPDESGKRHGSRRKDRLSGLVPDKREEPFWGEAKAGATNCVPKPPIGRADRHDRRRIKTFTALLDWGILRAAPWAGRRYYDAFAAGVAG